MKNYLLLIALAVTTLGNAAEENQMAGAIIRKAIKAAGGEGRFNTIKAPTMWMEKGTYHAIGNGVPFVAQYATYWPKRWYRQLIEGRFATGVAGDQVTLFRRGDSKGRKLSGPTHESALHQIRLAWASLLYPLLEDEYTLSNIPGVDVGGKTTVGIKAAHESGSEFMLYFDQRTFLLTKTEAMVAATQLDGKRMKVETFFRDHKSFGGAKLPGKYKTYFDGKLFLESERTAIKTHATIDPAWFGTTGPARVR